MQLGKKVGDFLHACILDDNVVALELGVELQGNLALQTSNEASGKRAAACANLHSGGTNGKL